MIERLVRLSPAPVPMFRVGGVPALTTSDIAAACMGADSFGLDIVLVKAAGYSSNDLFDKIHGLVKGLAQEHRWKTRKKGSRWHDLSSLVMLEYIHEPRCALCHGTKYYNAAPCEPCKGTGFIRLNDALRANAIGVNRSVWLRTWKRRYAQIIEAVNIHESDAVRSISKLLR